jgi:hypothetical protein
MPVFSQSDTVMLDCVALNSIASNLILKFIVVNAVDGEIKKKYCFRKVNVHLPDAADLCL